MCARANLQGFPVCFYIKSHDSSAVCKGFVGGKQEGSVKSIVEKQWR